MSNFTIIAEIGGTHIGKMSRAKKLIRLAKETGANVCKLQKRNPKESVKPEFWNKPHPNQKFAYGKTYLEHRENLELNQDQHSELKKYCEKIGIEYSTSVWDMTSAREIVEINPKMIKVPSACNDNTEMINYLYDNYNGEIHISLGMTTENERIKIINNIYEKRENSVNRTVLYHCTSGYPVPFGQLYLKEIQNLYIQAQRDHSNLIEPKKGIFKVGFSNHGFGIAMEPAAYTLGARYFERHLIDDRSFPHSDSAASLEKQGLTKLVRDLEALEKAMKYKPEQIDEIELVQRNKLRTTS